MKSLILILILISTITTFSQSKNGEPKLVEKVKNNKPTVFLDYVCQDKTKVRLRMYNNTDWGISVGSDKLYYKTKKTVKLANGIEFYAMPNDEEVSLLYRVEKFALPSENVKIPKIAYFHSYSINWIAAADSILFSVPIIYLKENLQVFVRFNYEWETNDKGVLLSKAPEHRVSFRGIDLDKSISCENN